MTTVEKREWIVQFPEDDKSKVERPSLVAACRGNKRIAEVLEHALCVAYWQAKQQNLPADFKAVNLQLNRAKIMEKCKICEKTLINYLDTLHAWGFLENERYQRRYILHRDKIQAAIDTPPAKEERAKREYCSRKSCKSTESSKNLQDSKAVDFTKVVELQEKTVMLQEKVVELQEKVVTLTAFQSALSTWIEAALKGNFGLDYILLYILQDITSNISALSDDEHASLSLSLEEKIAFLQQALSSKKTEIVSQLPAPSETIPDVQDTPPTSEQPVPNLQLGAEASERSYSPNLSEETASEPSQPTLPDITTPPDSAKPTERSTNRKRAEKPAKPAKEPKEPTPKKQKHHPDLGKWYGMFNTTYRDLGKNEGIPSNFTVPNLAQYADAFDSLIAAGATLEQGKWLLTDIWKDSDPFWRKHRTPTAMAKQYAVRIGRMPRNLRVVEPPAPETSKPVEQPSEATSAEGCLASRWTRILSQTEFFKLDLDVRKDYKKWEREQQKKVG
jgi:hypothetical protein